MSFTSHAFGASDGLPECLGIGKRILHFCRASVGDHTMECDWSGVSIEERDCHDKNDSLPGHTDVDDTSSLCTLSNTQSESGNNENGENDNDGDRNSVGNQVAAGGCAVHEGMNPLFRRFRHFRLMEVPNSVVVEGENDEDNKTEEEAGFCFPDYSPLGHWPHKVRENSCTYSSSNKNLDSPLDAGDDEPLDSSDVLRSVSVRPFVKRRSNSSKPFTPQAVPILGLSEPQKFTASPFLDHEAQQPSAAMQVDALTQTHMSTDGHGCVSVHLVTEVSLFYPVTPLGAQASFPGVSHALASDDTLTNRDVDA